MTNIVKIVCFGDSSVRWWELNESELWPAILQEELIKKGLNVEVINKGVPGDCTTGMLGRFYYDVIMQKPDYVIISGGGNDMWWNVPPAITKANIYSIIKQSVQHGVIPVLSIKGLKKSNKGPKISYEQYGNVWEPELGFEDFINRNILLTEAFMSDLVIPCNLLYIDFREAMNNIFYDKDGVQNKEYFYSDGMHLSAEGNKIIARVAAEYMCKLPKPESILRT